MKSYAVVRGSLLLHLGALSISLVEVPTSLAMNSLWLNPNSHWGITLPQSDADH